MIDLAVQFLFDWRDEEVRVVGRSHLVDEEGMLLGDPVMRCWMMRVGLLVASWSHVIGSFLQAISMIRVVHS
jgi:hypothetical protein